MPAPLRFLLLGSFFVLAVPGAYAEKSPTAKAIAALNEGNRLFRSGQIEAAAEAYLAGNTPGFHHPTLAFNLGTAYHHLDRLPEAILWYRRAGDSEDPWLRENLWLARRSLGTQALPAPGFIGALLRHGDLLRWLAVGIAWAAFVLMLARPSLGARILGAIFVLAVLFYTTAAAAQRWGPRPAVLLGDCRNADGELPAGTELWVRRQGGDVFRVAGTDILCPGESVGLVVPEDGSFRQGGTRPAPAGFEGEE